MWGFWGGVRVGVRVLCAVETCTFVGISLKKKILFLFHKNVSELNFFWSVIP